MSIPTATAENVARVVEDFEKEKPNGDSLLHELLQYERFDEALIVVDQGLLVDRSNSLGQSPLLKAIGFGSPSRLARGEKKDVFDVRRIVASFIAHEAPLYGAELFASNLMIGWNADDEDAALALIDDLIAHYGVNGTFKYGNTLLHAVAGAALPRVIERLLDAGCDPSAKNERGETAARAVAESYIYRPGAERCMALLLEHPKSGKRSGSELLSMMLRQAAYCQLAALDATLAQRTIELCRLITKHGEELSARDDEKMLPLDRFLAAVEKAGAIFDGDSYPTYMATPAAQTFARDVALYLHEAGGATPNMFPAAARGHLAYLLEALLEREKPSVAATYGKAKNTLLHEVLNRDEWSGEMTAQTIRCLLRYGISPEQTNAKGKTAWDLYSKVKRTLRPAWRKVIEGAYEGALAELSGTSAPKEDAKASKKSASSKETAAKKKPTKDAAAESFRFPCAGLHLAVLGALRDRKLMKLSLKKLLGGIEIDEDDEDLRREAVSLLHEVPIDPKAAAKLTKLDFSGGNAIYLEIEEILDADSGGESDDYQLTSLEGIDELSGLTSLSLDSYGYNPGNIDLAPLEGHPSLETLELVGNYENPGALEKIAKLSKIEGTPKLGAELVARLKGKGVELATSVE